jgi:GNAT superfamily N-acetyltransferase
VPWTSVGETREDLSAPERDPSLDDAILVDADGTPVGYLQQAGDSDASTELHSQVFVRPGSWGLGLSALLVRLGEERARAKVRRTPAREPVMLLVARFTHNEAAGRLFDALGYVYVRTVWMMRIELHEPPPRDGALTGAAIRTFDERDARATHAVSWRRSRTTGATSCPPTRNGATERSRGRGRPSTPACGSSRSRAMRSSAPPAAGRARPAIRARRRSRSSACGARGEVAASAWRCCRRRSRRCAAAGSRVRNSASIRRIPRARRACTSGPGCTSPMRGSLGEGTPSGRRRRRRLALAPRTRIGQA